MPGNATLQQAAEALATPKPSAQKGPSQRNKQVLPSIPLALACRTSAEILHAGLAFFILEAQSTPGG